MELLIIIAIFVGMFLVYRWYSKKNDNRLENKLMGKDKKNLFKEEDRTKAISVDEANKQVTFYYITDDKVEEKTFPVSKIISTELIEDLSKDNNCKSIRLKFEIDSIDFPLFQIIFLSDSWNNLVKNILTREEGFTQSSDEYLKASQQANKYLKLINSLKDQ